MQLSGAFWASSYQEDEALADVKRQAQEWADAEPRVVRCVVVKAFRPYQDRALWWQVDMELEMAA